MWQKIVATILAASAAFTTAACAPTAPKVNVIDLRTVATSPVAIASGTQPGRTANYYLTPRISPSMVDSLARYDLLILGVENAVNNPEVLDAIRQKHPGIKLLFYVQSNELTWEHDEPPTGPWHQLESRMDSTCFLHDEHGQIVSFDPSGRSYDLTNSTVSPILAQWINEQFAIYPWDGVFIDNVWANVTWYNDGHVDTNRDGIADDMAEFDRRWRIGLVALGTQVRCAIGTNHLLVGNISNDHRTDHRLWVDQANGRMFEGFPHTLGTSELAPAYIGVSGWQPPPVIIVHLEANRWEFDAMRSAWAFTLLGNGYFAVDHGPTPGPGDDTGWHDETQWQAWLTNQPRGLPITAPFQDQHSGLWIREYAQLIVAWNPNSGTTTTDLIARNGRLVTLTVPPATGIIVPQP